MYRADGPQGMKPVGEVEFVNGNAAMSASGHYGKSKLCAGIIGHADLTLGDNVRPVLEALLRRLGYKIPQVKKGDETGLIVLLRVTPGIPFPVQNYLLGLARASFGRYLLISFLIQGPLNAAFVVFGDALLHGKGQMAFYGISAIVVLLVGTHLLRKHYTRKKTP